MLAMVEQMLAERLGPEGYQRTLQSPGAYRGALQGLDLPPQIMQQLLKGLPVGGPAPMGVGQSQHQNFSRTGNVRDLLR